MAKVEFNTGDQDHFETYPDQLREWVGQMRRAGIELPEIFELEKFLGRDQVFQVTAVIYSQPRKRGAEVVPTLRTLPHRNAVLAGVTHDDDEEFPASVHPTSELAAWLAGGEGIKRISHARLAEWAGQLVKDAAGRARRRNKIDIVT